VLPLVFLFFCLSFPPPCSSALLQAAVEAREPFLNFVFSRINADGSRQVFQVSGEPMFGAGCKFLGYRGIGVEIKAKR
jgi:hypothetical protein